MNSRYSLLRRLNRQLLEASWSDGGVKGEMQFQDGRLIINPSDLASYFEYEYVTQQEPKAAQ